MRHQGWWFRFRDGKTVRPKALEIETKNNLLANHLPDWCAALTVDQWGCFSGQDQTVLGILLTIALLQEMGPDGPNRPAQLQTCREMFFRVQVVVHRSNTLARPESEPALPHPAGVALTDWDSSHAWAATANSPAFATVDIETDSEGPLPPMSARFDQNVAVMALEALDNGKPIPRSPKKLATPLSLRLPSVGPHASPSMSRSAAPALFSGPQHLRPGTSPSDTPDFDGLQTIPEDQEIAGSAGLVLGRPEGTAGSSDEEGLGALYFILSQHFISTDQVSSAKKRKRSTTKPESGAKRSRLDKLSGTPTAAAAPAQPGRITRSGSRTPAQPS